MTCEAEASEPVTYTVAIRDRYGEMLDFYQGNTGVSSDKCLIELNSIDAGSRYELIVKSESDTFLSTNLHSTWKSSTSMVFLPT